MKLRRLANTANRRASECGEVKWGLLLWAIGVPLPIVLLVVLFRGC